jgi:hypothetical protein
MELTGSWNHGARPDPWMLRCTYQTRPGGRIFDQVELARSLRKLRFL